MTSLVTKLQRSVARAPASEALVDGARRVNYAALWAEAQAVAAFFVGNGLPRGARVALLLENSAAYVAAYYGILAAGGVAVPLNVAAKAHDVIGWLDHCGATWLILDVAHPEAAAVRGACEGRVRLITATRELATYQWPQLAESPTVTTPEAGASAVDDLATILYTSGTTGRPKGVMLSHRNLCTNVDSILTYLDLGPTDRIVNVLPFYYSYGSSVLHTHLAAGGCVILEDNLIYPHRFLERVVAEGATGLAGVPSTFALLLSRVRLENYDLRRLRYVTQAGGPMPTALWERVRRGLAHCRCYAMYGQTEATARLSYVPPDRLDDKPGSVGQAIPGVELDVRDEQGESLPAFAVGEVWARGPNIMLGYWNDAELTREVLAEGGWLKTGDLGYRDDNGFLYLQGRQTEMIKTGAHRIHPHEIEATIGEIEGVVEVAAVGVPDALLGQAVAVYVVVANEAGLDAMAIKAHCRRRLANYKLPKHVQFVSCLPRTASGKVQRFKLAQAG